MSKADLEHRISQLHTTGISSAQMSRQLTAEGYRGVSPSSIKRRRAAMKPTRAPAPASGSVPAPAAVTAICEERAQRLAELRAAEKNAHDSPTAAAATLARMRFENKGIDRMLANGEPVVSTLIHFDRLDGVFALSTAADVAAIARFITDDLGMWEPDPGQDKASFEAEMRDVRNAARARAMEILRAASLIIEGEIESSP